MQPLRFCVTNDRDHFELQYVGLFPDGKLPFDYIWSYGLKLDESRTIEVHRNLSLFPRSCSFTLSSCRVSVDFGKFLIPLRIRDVEGIALCLHNPNGNPLARVVLFAALGSCLPSGSWQNDTDLPASVRRSTRPAARFLSPAAVLWSP